uniref:Uncharacterized protein n=1 Tax=Anguilla anguilla TaxID=7936 RepID=A0A0E9V757_ANGAN
MCPQLYSILQFKKAPTVHLTGKK